LRGKKDANSLLLSTSAKKKANFFLFRVGKKKKGKRRKGEIKRGQEKEKNERASPSCSRKSAYFFSGRKGEKKEDEGTQKGSFARDRRCRSFSEGGEEKRESSQPGKKKMNHIRHRPLEQKRLSSLFEIARREKKRGDI